MEKQGPMSGQVVTSRLQGRCEQHLKDQLLLVFLILVCPLLVWSQDGGLFAPGVKVWVHL
jgi:hypothetical protein